ncbi:MULTISPECIES: hypothetical protein [unclassified Streptomyces]|uniref:hypothetical protein n=1 Tax=unclassified Streptomyces TaxID=2593676 RepID=UPI00114C8C50|nr:MULTISPECIES: hypothetical protein [unclassified Streptomyces]MYS22575.1 hypothetical protein [Streptomyces sp. SID4948]
MLEDPWSDRAIAAHLYDPSAFFTDQDSSLAHVDRVIDARMDEIYRSLPGDRLSLFLSATGTVAATVWLSFAGTRWAIAPGVVTLAIVAVWIIAVSPNPRRRPLPPETDDEPEPFPRG